MWGVWEVWEGERKKGWGNNQQADAGTRGRTRRGELKSQPKFRSPGVGGKKAEGEGFELNRAVLLKVPLSKGDLGGSKRTPQMQ
ncbi:MAG: hypothetical protein F6K41_07550 [Symploca sp. SIO3E6]|nr:hypothetical protein [Caldora sp. SIO3E6]